VTLADDLKPLLSTIRSIPGQLGLRPYTVAIVLKEYGGDTPGDGIEQETVTEITEANGQPPKVRFLTDEELAVGGLGSGSVKVGPITPSNLSGGVSWAALTQTEAANNTVRAYRLTGPQFPDGADFMLVGSDSGRALHYTLTLAPVAQ